MTEQLPTRDFRSLVQMLRSQWPVAAAVVVILTGTVLFLDIVVREPLYRSDTEILVRNSATDLVAGQGQRDAARSMSNERGLAESRSVTDVLEQKYGIDVRISVDIADNRDVLILSGVAESATLAQEIAGDYAATYLDVRAKATLDDLLEAGDVIGERLRDLDERIDALGSPAVDSAEARDVDLLLTQRSILTERLDRLALNSDLITSGTGRVISPANLPLNPVSPNTVRDGILILVSSLLLGIGLAYLRALLSDDDEQAEKLSQALQDVPSFVELPRVEHDPRLSVVYQPTAPYSEALRTLRTAVRFVIPRQRSVQVVSPMPNDGKTTVSANLAYALALDGYRVALVDADLRNKGLSHLFGLGHEDLGLASIIEESDSVAAIDCWHDRFESIWFLPAGRANLGPAELLGKPSFSDLVQSLTRMFDIVLIDSPPLLPVADGLLIAGIVDETILTVGRQTASDDVRRARQVLRNVDVNPSGVVLNGRTGVQLSYGYGVDLDMRQNVLPGSDVLKNRFDPATLNLTETVEDDASKDPEDLNPAQTTGGAFGVASSSGPKSRRVVNGTDAFSDGRAAVVGKARRV